jgi:hypothetical protein
MKLLFAYTDIQDSQKWNLIFFTICRPISRQVGQINTQGERGNPILLIPNLIALIPNNKLPKQTKAYRPLLRLDQNVHHEVLGWSDATTQKGAPTASSSFITRVDDNATDTLGKTCLDILGLRNPLRKKLLNREIFLEATFTGVASSITSNFKLCGSLVSFELKGSLGSDAGEEPESGEKE